MKSLNDLAVASSVYRDLPASTSTIYVATSRRSDGEYTAPKLGMVLRPAPATDWIVSTGKPAINVGPPPWPP